MAKQYVCKVCGYVHTGNQAPDTCPQCKQSNCFEEVKKRRFSTDSNAYTIIYATILVVIVAVLLAVVSQVLSSRQKANALLDTQKQILVALNQDVDACEDPAVLYNSIVRDTLYLVSHYGQAVVDMNVMEKMSEAEQHQYAAEHGAPVVYFAVVDNELKMVLPLKGQGLWGGIWGYITLNDDLNTIYGINFGHEGETPGLGAEIVTENFRSRFFGKHIKDAEGNLRSVAVLKEGKFAENGQEQVDAWAGATITSTGVNDMLANSLDIYHDALVGDLAIQTIQEFKAKYLGIVMEEN